MTFCTSVPHLRRDGTHLSSTHIFITLTPMYPRIAPLPSSPLSMLAIMPTSPMAQFATVASLFIAAYHDPAWCPPRGRHTNSITLVPLAVAPI